MWQMGQMGPEKEPYGLSKKVANGYMGPPILTHMSSVRGTNGSYGSPRGKPYGHMTSEKWKSHRFPDPYDPYVHGKWVQMGPETGHMAGERTHTVMWPNGEWRRRIIYIIRNIKQLGTRSQFSVTVPQINVIHLSVRGQMPSPMTHSPRMVHGGHLSSS